MGNGCICFKNLSSHYKDVKLDTLLEEQIQNENEQIEATNLTNLYNIAKYFNEGEKEINTKIEIKNVKRIISHKKAKNFKSYNNVGDLKYELMLKRLLEQKIIERKGPKRRNTLRINNNKDAIEMIKEVIDENKISNNNKSRNENNDSNNDNENSLTRGSILLNIKDKKMLDHGRQSLNIVGKKFKHKQIKNKFEETEINTHGLELNEIKNTSNYISDAIYACLPKRNSPKK
jgi:hypothetical protein